MSKKLYWGLGVLFLLFIGGFVFLLIQQKAELNQWEADAAKDKKKLVTAETPPIVKNKPPPPEPGYEWVQHGDHFHEVPIAEVSQETPVIDEQTPEETDLSALDENFYKNYSRERLEENIKSFQQSSDLIQTVNIPANEERRDKYVKLLESNPDSKYYKEGLAGVTAKINWYKSVIRNSEKLITVMSNVLNGEETNVEK